MDLNNNPWLSINSNKKSNEMDWSINLKDQTINNKVKETS